MSKKDLFISEVENFVEKLSDEAKEYFEEIKKSPFQSKEITDKALNRLKVNNYGLDSIDIEYLDSLINKFNGGPVGVETLATSIGEEVSTLEDVIEPYLLQEGFVKRTRSGRVATEKSYSVVERRGLV